MKNELEVRVAALEKRVTQLEALLGDGGKPNAAAPTKDLSVKEFILSKAPANDVERTLAIACFLERFAGYASFNVDDLARHFQLAKEAIPININDKVNLNIKKGHLAEANEKKDKKKAWIVTNSGDQFVESSFGRAR
jgi:hypothetical protein